MDTGFKKIYQVLWNSEKEGERETDRQTETERQTDRHTEGVRTKEEEKSE